MCSNLKTEEGYKENAKHCFKKKNTNSIKNQKSVIFAVTLTGLPSLPFPTSPIHIESDLNFEKKASFIISLEHIQDPLRVKVN